MKTTLKKMLAGALIAGTALAFGGCKEKQSANSEQVARSNDTAAPNPSDQRPTNPLNAATPPSLNTQGDPRSPEIAHNGPQGSALAPQTDLVPPDNTQEGTNNPTGASPANDQAQGTEMHRATAFGQQGNQVAANEKVNESALDKAVNQDLKPSDTTDPQAQREAAYGQAAERLAKLDARVSDIRARVDALSNKAVFSDTLTDLRRLHETSQSAIDQIRDRNVKLDDARESADRRMTQFEAAINSAQKRIEKAASQT